MPNEYPNVLVAASSQRMNIRIYSLSCLSPNISEYENILWDLFVYSNVFEYSLRSGNQNSVAVDLCFVEFSTHTLIYSAWLENIKI